MKPRKRKNKKITYYGKPLWFAALKWVKIHQMLHNYYRTGKLD